MRIASLSLGRPRQSRLLKAAGAGLAILAVALAIAFLWSDRTRSVSLPSLPEKPTLPRDVLMPAALPPPNLLRPLAPTEAIEENAKREFAQRPDSPAEAFRLNSDAASRERAIECLTQAVYYEAAAEGPDGGRAVAQVVLNRVRHPAYPSSVCGVVYQGSDRPTGCQFTFTCDGSLASLPSRHLWAQARRIAGEALAGKVYGAVGHTTHYHADYVLPYWADSLDKSLKVGRHIFYRLKGSLGSEGVFRQRYAGREPMPPPPSTATTVTFDTAAIADELLREPPGQAVPGVTAPTGELIAMAAPRAEQQLFADATSGTLIIDGGLAPPATVKHPKNEDCPTAADGKKLRPMTAINVRVQSKLPEC